MRGYGLLRSHPGLRRILCVSLVMGLILSTFTGFVYAEEIDEEPVVIAGQIDDQDDQDDQDVVVDDEITDDDDQEINDEIVDDQDGDDQDDQDIASDDEITDDEDVDPEDKIDNEDEDEDTGDEIDIEAPVEEVSQPAVLAGQGNGKKVILWTPDTDYYVGQYSSIIKGHFDSMSGVTTVVKTDTTFTEDELSGVDVVYTMVWKVSYSSTNGQEIISNAPLLKSFVENGGKLVLNGEHEDGNFASNGNTTLEKLAYDMGFSFTIDGFSSNKSSVLNTEGRPDLTANIEKDFASSWFGIITTSDPEAVWVAKDTTGNIFILDKLCGQGRIVVVTDINYLDSSTYSPEVSRAFLANIAGYVYVHTHNFSYSASGATLTATCSAGVCPLADRKIAITIKAPEKTAFNDGKSAEATIEGLDEFNEATGLNLTEADIMYFDDDTGEQLNAAPTDAGYYYAVIRVENNSAYVDYAIGKAQVDAELIVEDWVAGDDASSPEIKGTIGTGAVTIEFKAKGADDSEYSKAIPTAVGDYVARAKIAESKNFFEGTLTTEFSILPVTYSFDDGVKTWYKDSKDALSYRASRNAKNETAIDHFTGVLVDGKAVAAEYVTVKSGSVIVELKTTFLNTLELGDHTITFTFDDASPISTKFTVKEATSSPQTGEHTGPAVLFAAMLLLAASSYTGVKVFKKKEN